MARMDSAQCVDFFNLDYFYGYAIGFIHNNFGLYVWIGFCCWRCSHSVRWDWNCLLAAAAAP